MAKIHEVAKAAGVSISTVSYALSGKRTISAETRRRIELAVRELDYRPHAGARMLGGTPSTLHPRRRARRSAPDTYAPAHMAFVLAVAGAARSARLRRAAPHAGGGGRRGLRRVASQSGSVDGIVVLDVAERRRARRAGA